MGMGAGNTTLNGLGCRDKQCVKYLHTRILGSGPRFRFFYCGCHAIARVFSPGMILLMLGPNFPYVVPLRHSCQSYLKTKMIRVIRIWRPVCLSLRLKTKRSYELPANPAQPLSTTEQRRRHPGYHNENITCHLLKYVIPCMKFIFTSM